MRDTGRRQRFFTGPECLLIRDLRLEQPLFFLWENKMTSFYGYASLDSLGFR